MSTTTTTEATPTSVPGALHLPFQALDMSLLPLEVCKVSEYSERSEHSKHSECYPITLPALMLRLTLQFLSFQEGSNGKYLTPGIFPERACCGTGIRSLLEILQNMMQTIEVDFEFPALPQLDKTGQ
jgi:hypothetical protein